MALLLLLLLEDRVGGAVGELALASLSDAGVVLDLDGVLLFFGLGRWSGRLAETLGEGDSMLLFRFAVFFVVLFAVFGSEGFVFLPLRSILSFPICLACFLSSSRSLLVSLSLYSRYASRNRLSSSTM